MMRDSSTALGAIWLSCMMATACGDNGNDIGTAKSDNLQADQSPNLDAGSQRENDSMPLDTGGSSPNPEGTDDEPVAEPSASNEPGDDTMDEDPASGVAGAPSDPDDPQPGAGGAPPDMGDNGGARSEAAGAPSIPDDSQSGAGGTLADDGGNGGTATNSGGSGAMAGGSAGNPDAGSAGAPPVDCGCATMPRRLVCGTDGEIYDATCGLECVPVPIECDGRCPCPATNGDDITLTCWSSEDQASFSKACQTTADCVTVEHWQGCCAVQIIGLASDQTTAFSEYETSTCDGQPPCGCAFDQLIADDGTLGGRELTPSVECVDNVCRSTLR